jgi:hypothetical protein
LGKLIPARTKFTGARVSVNGEDPEVGEELEFLSLSTAATWPFIDVRSGGLHRERRIIGGGSGAWQSSTELPLPRGWRWWNGKLGWVEELRCWAGLMGFGQVSPSSLFFSSFVSFLFSFCFADLKTLIWIPLSFAGFELETSYQI